MGKGERIVWLKLESRHYEFLASDNSEEFRAARRAHIKEIAEIYKVAFNKLDCVKDDCVKDLDGGAASRCGLRLKGSDSACFMSCPTVRSHPFCQEGSLCANKSARVICSKGTSSACSMSVCEKISPSARGLTESKLERIEETVSVKVSRGGARSDVVSLPPSLGPAGEKHGGCLAYGSKVTALSMWRCAASRREHELAMVQSFRRLQKASNVVVGDQSVEKHRALWLCRQVPKLCEIVWMMPLL